jgi:hypothetical protein
MDTRRGLRLEGTFYFNLYSINDSPAGYGWAQVSAKTAGASY